MVYIVYTYFAASVTACHPLCIYSVVSLSDRVKNEQLKALNRGEDISRVVVYLFLILSLIQVAVFV